MKDMNKVKVKLAKQNAEYYGMPVGAIEDVSLEDYVIGVVAAQIGNAHVQACKAQAIAARTFVYPYMTKDKAVSDSSDAQVFSAKRLSNAKEQYPNVVKAVEATHGLVLCYMGEVIPTCSYCDANGGRIVSALQRWGGERPWLVSKDDPWDLKASNGKRNGHGVGMSQKGAAYAASIGVSYAEILRFYYPGTQIYGKEASGMAKTVNSLAFANAAESLYDKYQIKGMVVYANGKSGQLQDGRYLCDCRGYVIWSLRTLGITITSTGTNWMIRNQMREVKPITKVEQLQVGQVVFKKYDKGNPKWNLPARYRKGEANYNKQFDELDVYHVGIVKQVTPTLIIRHCTSGGIKTDTKLGAWCFAGYVDWVIKETVPQQNDLTEITKPLKNGDTGLVMANKVNLRKLPKTSAYRLAYLNTGDKVTILEEDCGASGWLYVKSGNITGYIMASFVKKG